MSEAEDRVDELISAARKARRHAYAPYSNFPVGAAVLSGGVVFTGVNVENAAYPSGICAERSAVFAAVSAGQRRIDAVAIVGISATVTPPCGACRQVLNEFGPEMLVVCESTVGIRKTWRLPELLPEAFGPDDLPG